jgi:WD40 repeat protein
VRVWDSSTGEVQNVLEGHMDSVWSVAFCLMADASSLAQRTIWCGYGIHQWKRCRTCPKATRF